MPHALIDITTDRRSGKPHPGIRLHRVRCLPEADRTVVRGIPVTSVARMLLDMSEIVGRGRLARLVREADYQGLLDLDALDDVIARSHGRRRVALLTDVLKAHRPGKVVRSELEQRFLELCRNHGIPEPETNVRIAVAGRRYELDCLWPDSGVVVELDGARAHDTARAFETDRARDTALVHSAALHVAAPDDGRASRGGRAPGGVGTGGGSLRRK